ncbi:MAG: alpha/beta hydrolase [Candidatus Wallbacteria bacterium]|nr:alpha/beta hydrolase [Candidatus Wallbacteria bacterium]
MSPPALVTLVGGAVLVLGAAVWLLVWIVGFMVGLFLDHPIVILRLEPEESGAEPGMRDPDVHFLGRDGTKLRGWLVRSPQPTRRVIAFFHEYGADAGAWSRYLSFLPAEGFHVFTFDFRGAGESEAPKGYRPFKWATAGEVADADAALCYLRAKAEEEGWEVAAFGASRGASALMMAAAGHPWLQTIACEGMSSTLGSIHSYMRRWARIYIPDAIVEWTPDAVWRMFAHLVVVASENREGVRFPPLEWHLAQLQGRRILFIYGERDALITPQHRDGILRGYRGPRALWMLPRTGHLAGPVQFAAEYRHRVTAWFLGEMAPRVLPSEDRSSVLGSRPSVEQRNPAAVA